MEVSDAIWTRLEVREYVDEPVSTGAKRAILEAGRLAPSGKNRQHWRFVLVEDATDRRTLAHLSTTGAWIAGADFAVVVLTDPTLDYHGLDAGRAVTHMQFEAWDRGVGSCIYTGYDEAGMREFLDVSDDVDVTVVAGFGYPTFDVESIDGRKNRVPLSTIAYDGRVDEPLDRFE